MGLAKKARSGMGKKTNMSNVARRPRGKQMAMGTAVRRGTMTTKPVRRPKPAGDMAIETAGKAPGVAPAQTLPTVPTTSTKGDANKIQAQTAPTTPSNKMSGKNPIKAQKPPTVKTG